MTQSRHALLAQGCILVIGVAAGVLAAPSVGRVRHLWWPATHTDLVVVRLTGGLAPGTADQIVPRIDVACRDNAAELILRVTSEGGSPTEGNRIGRALDRCRALGVRVTGFAETVGASAAYLALLGSDRILAEPYALVGGVGALITRRVANDGTIAIASGAEKGAFHRGSAMTPAHRRALLNLVAAGAKRFLDRVAERRGSRITDWSAVANGRLAIAADAEALGLIDGVSDWDSELARASRGRRVRYIDSAPGELDLAVLPGGRR